MVSPVGSVSFRDAFLSGVSLRKIHMKGQSPSESVPLIRTTKGMGSRLQNQTWISRSKSKQDFGMSVCGCADVCSRHLFTSSKFTVLAHEVGGDRTEGRPPVATTPIIVTSGPVKQRYSARSKLLASRTIEAFCTPTVAVLRLAVMGPTCSDSNYGAQSSN